MPMFLSPVTFAVDENVRVMKCYEGVKHLVSGSCRASHADMVTRISIVESHMGKRAAYYIGARTSRARLTALGPTRC